MLEFENIKIGVLSYRPALALFPLIGSEKVKAEL